MLVCQNSWCGCKGKMPNTETAHQLYLRLTMIKQGSGSRRKINKGSRMRVLGGAQRYVIVLIKLSNVFARYLAWDWQRKANIFLLGSVYAIKNIHRVHCADFDGWYFTSFISYNHFIANLACTHLRHGGGITTKCSGIVSQSYIMRDDVVTDSSLSIRLQFTQAWKASVFVCCIGAISTAAKSSGTGDMFMKRKSSGAVSFFTTALQPWKKRFVATSQGRGVQPLAIARSTAANEFELYLWDAFE